MQLNAEDAGAYSRTMYLHKTIDDTATWHKELHLKEIVNEWSKFPGNRGGFDCDHSVTLKPNLAAIRQGRVHVVNVTIRYEDRGYLEGIIKDRLVHTPAPSPSRAALRLLPYGPTYSMHEGSITKTDDRLPV